MILSNQIIKILKITFVSFFIFILGFSFVNASSVTSSVTVTITSGTWSTLTCPTIAGSPATTLTSTCSPLGTCTGVAPTLSCLAVPALVSCSDGILNQDETGIDTGGVCASGSLTISPTSCVIASGASTCTVTGAKWITSKATSPALIDANTNTTLSTLANNSTALKIWIAYPQTIFKLQDGSKILDSSSSTTVTSSCIAGTSWDGIKCNPIIPPTETCSDGILNQDETGIDTGGVCASASGNISATDCEIAVNASTCVSKLNWSTSNLIADKATAVTRNNPNGTLVSSNTSGTNVSNIINYGSSNFYLYHNTIELNSTGANATCVSNTLWDKTLHKCIASTITFGILSATDCEITAGNSSCLTTLKWETTNGVGTSEVTTPINISVSNVNSNIIGKTYSVNYGSRNFYLYNNSEELATATATAKCIVGTSWNATLGKCIVDISALYPDLKVSINDNYLKIDNSDGPEVYVSYEPDSGSSFPFVLSWEAVAGATSCNLNGDSVSIDGGSITKYVSTWTNNSQKFVLSCTGVNGISGSDSITLKYPFPPTDLSSSCNGSDTVANINWTAPTGFDAFYTRAIDLTDGSKTVLYNDNQKNTKDSFPVKLGDSYKYWIHSKALNGAFGPAVYGDITIENSCITPPPTCSDGLLNQDETSVDTGGVCGIIKCSEPLVKDITGIACDKNSKGESAISGSVTRRQMKSAPSCTFGDSVWLSDTCVYPSDPVEPNPDNNGGTDGTGGDGGTGGTGGGTGGGGSTSPVNGYWSSWTPSISCKYISSVPVVQSSTYIKAINGGVEAVDFDGINYSKERTVSANDCSTIDTKINGKKDSSSNDLSNTNIAFNSKVTIDWSSPIDKTESCTCSWYEVLKPGIIGSCGVNTSGTYTSPALKRSTNYNIK